MSNTNSKTNGRSKTLVSSLETRVRNAIDATLLTGERHPNGANVYHDTEDARAIRDYVRNQHMFDKFDDLIDREVQGERRHRKHAPAGFVYPISVRQAATAIILHNLGSGAAREAMPSAVLFISLRDTAAEAMLVGYLARVALRADAGLLEALDALDYAQAVRS
jgi:hypothetical protein